MSGKLTIRKGNQEVTIEGKTVEDYSPNPLAYVLPGVGQALLIADYLTGQADYRSKVTIHTDRGDFTGYGRTEEEAEEQAWREFERKTGFSRPR